MPTERMHMKTLLAQLEQGNPKVFSSILTALRPLLSAPELAAETVRKSDNIETFSGE
jgi:tRNA 2-thiocytidine biosynthesis protein TtcA